MATLFALRMEHGKGKAACGVELLQKAQGKKTSK